MTSVWSIALLAVLAPVLLTSGQHDMQQLEHRSVIAQMFEWRFEDIAFECEQHLGPKGYAAVQVSPVNEHITLDGHPWSARYQPISYRIQTRSGNEQQFADMTKRCNLSGVRVYVDVVLNHMAGPHSPAATVRGSAGSAADPSAFDYPAVPFEREHFHPPCTITNWNRADDLRNCALAGLPDLNQTRPYVRQQQVDFLNRLVKLGAGGFRVDAAKHMWPADLKAIFDAVDDLNVAHGFTANSRPFVLLDIVDFGSAPGELGRWQYKHLGRITDFLVPGELGRAFRGYNALRYLRNWGPQWTFLPGQLGVVFLVDHEQQRGQGLGGSDTISSRDNRKLYTMASAFMLAHPLGTPRVLSSYQYTDALQGAPQDAAGNLLSPGRQPRTASPTAEAGCQNGWICEHRWPAVANMVELRAVAGRSEFSNWWDNGGKQIAFSRGDRAFVAWNGEKWQDFEEVLQTCLPAGRYCDVMTGEAVAGRCTGGEVLVDGEGKATVRIADDSGVGVLAIHVGGASALSRTCPRMMMNELFSKYAKTSCFRGLQYHMINLQY